jgi:predicted deacylase
MTARTIQTIELDEAYVGTRRSLTVLRWGKPGARPKIYMQAALHAGEMTGVIALEHLAGLLDEQAEAGAITGEIVLVPMANPIGLAQFMGGDHFGRVETGSYINFNREHFDVSDAVMEAVRDRLGPSAQANVETIRAAAVDIAGRFPGPGEWASLRRHLLALCLDADVVLDLHSDMQATMFMYTNAVDDDAARVLGADIGCRAIVNLAPYVPSRTFCGVVGGLFPRIAERVGPGVPVPQSCFAAMIEVRGRHACSDDLAATDAANFLRYCRRLGAIAGDPGPLPPLLCEISPADGMDVGYAPAPGFTVYHRKAGDVVSAGDLVCEIVNPTAATPAARRLPVHARSEGVIYARWLAGVYVPPGRVLFRIAGPRPLEHRKGRSWLDD